MAREKEKQKGERSKLDIEESKQRNKLRQPALKTKVVDYSAMRSVRIDSKTHIYAKPSESVEQVKERYFSIYGTKKSDN
jgi:hypothetical protein